MGKKAPTSCQALVTLLSRIRQSAFASYVYCKTLTLQGLFDLTCINQNQKPQWWWELCFFWELLMRLCSVLTSQSCSKSLACGHISLPPIYTWFWWLTLSHKGLVIIPSPQDYLWLLPHLKNLIESHLQCPICLLQAINKFYELGCKSLWILLVNYTSEIQLCFLCFGIIWWE